jgi:hypothetical protein
MACSAYSLPIENGRVTVDILPTANWTLPNVFEYYGHRLNLVNIGVSLNNWMSMVRGFKYRFYPTPEQKRILCQDVKDGASAQLRAVAEVIRRGRTPTIGDILDYELQPGLSSDGRAARLASNGSQRTDQVRPQISEMMFVRGTSDLSKARAGID